MTALASAAAGLQGALLLARGRAEGAALIEPGAQGARRSFWALAASLPILVLLHVADGPAPDSTPLLSSLAASVVGWLGFAVLSHRGAAALGAGERWFGFIAAWNWCSVVQQALVAAGLLVGLSGVPAPVPLVALLVTTGWAIWLEWYAARVTLGVGGVAAAGIVLFDYAVNLVVFSIGSAANGSSG